MDFQTLSRRQLQALCKKNKIPANITNVAMADSLTALQFVEGIDEILNTSESEIPQSPMVPPTGGRSRAVRVQDTPAAVGATATRRRAAAATTSVRRKIEDSSNESLDEIEEVKISEKTPAVAPASRRRGVRETSNVKPVYSTRRSTRLAEKIEAPKQISEAIKMNSFNEEVDENVEVEMKGDSVDQSQCSEITEEIKDKSNDESEAISEETNGGDVAVAITEQITSSDVKPHIDQEEDEQVNVLMEAAITVSENVCGIETDVSIEAHETKASVEDTEMNSNENVEVEASFEVNEDVEVKTSIEVSEEAKRILEDTEMSIDVDEQTKASIKNTEIDSSVDEEPKTSFEDTEMNTNVDEATNLDAKEDEEIAIAAFEGHVDTNVTVDIQEADKEEHNENETSADDMCDEEMIVPEVEIQDEQAAKGGDVHIEQAPMKNSVEISDDKENIDGGRKSVAVAEDISMRQLIKKIKKLEICMKQKKEEGKGEEMMKGTITRPALKTLSENMMVESQD